MSKNKKRALEQYGPKHFEVQPFDTTGLERGNTVKLFVVYWVY